MMKRYETGDPDILEYRSSQSWILTGAGLFFLIPGIFVGTAAFWDHGVYSFEDHAFSIGFGAVFTSIGVLMVFFRKGRRIDRRKMIARSWWGLLIPLYTKEYPIASVKHVSIELRSGGEETDTYLVQIVAAGSIPVDDPAEYMQARGLAKDIARFLKTGIVDSSSNETVIYGAGTLDLSLKEKADRFKEACDVPDPPKALRSKVSRENGELTIEIPGAELGRKAVIPILTVGLLSTFPGFVALFTSGISDIGFNLTRILFILIPFGITVGGLWLVYMHILMVRCRVKLSNQSLTVLNKSPFRTKKIKIPLKDLEELVLLKDHSYSTPIKLLDTLTAQAIKARSHTCEASFGAHLSRAERTYLKAVLHQSIIGKV